MTQNRRKLWKGIYFGTETIHAIPLELQISPVDFFSVLSEHCESAFLLESSEGAKKLARFSFLGFSPRKHLRLKNGVMNVNGEESDEIDPLTGLKSHIADVENDVSFSNSLRNRVPQDRKSPTPKPTTPGFLGGAVGYFSFDFVRYMETLPNNLTDEVHFPDFEFGIFDDAIVFDHAKNQIRYLYSGKSRLEEILAFIKDSSFEAPAFQMYNRKCNKTKEAFCADVATAKEHINAGDIFQVVLSKRYEIKYSGSLLPFYRKLKATNPSPYMYYLKFGERQVIGSSPENLIRVEDREISSYATLAGTRPRGKTGEEDAKLETELLQDEKERAEHIMLVDLTRNDIGKIAEPGSVQVPELMQVHKYSQVQHLASLVTGKLATRKDAFDAFRAIFPAGTVSGAPKVRAMEIMEALEKTKRGPYAGAVGYFSSNGNADFAIGIRTLFANGNKAYIQTGAGIVYDSIPEKEYEETENKAKALLHAIGDEKYEAAINR